MLCKSLRAAAKNDAPCRFLNAIVRIPIIKFRSNKKPDKICRVFVAEEEGFEPPWAFTQTVFKTASL